MLKFVVFSIFLLVFKLNIKAEPQKVQNKMVLIPGGTYEMGSRKSAAEMDVMDILNPDRHALGPEDPAHSVHVDTFYIDIYEVTNQEYWEYVKATKSKKPAFWANAGFNGPKQPVVGVSWKEANSFCEWRKKRLPTEAEWEKASRGKKHITFPWGNEEPDETRLNYNNHVGKTVAVGSYEAGKSDYGVYDLSGNAAEWVWDWHNAEYYIFSSEKNPKGPRKGQYKVVRGGNWRNNRDDVRLTYRNATVPKIRGIGIGFRCASGINPDPK